jgi:antitoxin component of MazEF toxin-antitoxin module
MESSPKKQKAKKASALKGKSHKAAYKQPQVDEANNPLNEAVVEYTAKVRAIGNSKGVILNNQVLDTAGLKADMDILIQAFNGMITIKQAEKPAVNTDLSTWEKHLKAAIKAGNKPEGDFFEGMANEFDKSEW